MQPPGRGRLAVLPRCSLLTSAAADARRPARIATRSVAGGAGLEKQPTDPGLPDDVIINMRDGRLG
jgi:hypothetical protein